jgi:hypothetical protein
MEAKIEWKLTWHCCIFCNPAKGRVDFEDGWLIKSSFITKDEMKACQLTRTKFPQKDPIGNNNDKKVRPLLNCDAKAYWKIK